jgi:flagellar basal body P-ring protein FlgI
MQTSAQPEQQPSGEQPAAKPAEAPAEGPPQPGTKPQPIPNLAELLAKLREQEPGKYRKIGEICQVKTYRIEVLQGFGLVVDMSELARALGSAGRGLPSATSGSGLGIKPGGALGLQESPRATEPTTAEVKTLLSLLERAGEEDVLSAVPESFWQRRTVVLVSVTVTVPPEGARKGDRLDCQVKAFEPKSLAGCFLLPTKLYPPGPREGTPVGLAAGPVVSESGLRMGGDRVIAGCVVQQDIAETCVRDGKLRLLLRPEHADFLTAQDVADRINVEVGLFAGKPIARALSASVVEVDLPSGYEENPVGFITQLLRLPSSVPIEQPAQPGLPKSIFSEPRR